MIALIAGLVTLANTLMTFVHDATLMKLVNEMKDIQTQLIDEKQKGYNSDDALIENLYAKFHVAHDAFQAQLAVLKPAAS